MRHPYNHFICNPSDLAAVRGMVELFLAMPVPKPSDWNIQFLPQCLQQNAALRLVVKTP